MRGTSFKSLWNQSLARCQGSQSLLLLASAIIFAGTSSGCASVSATKTAAAQLSVVPSTIDFKSVVVGQKNSQTVKITNAGKSAIDLQQLRVSGSGFVVSSSTAPVALAPGAAMNLTVVFSPVKDVASTGSLVISGPELKNSLTVPLSGSGEKAAAALAASPASLNFGIHAVKSSTAQSVTLTNTGNISVSITSVDLGGSAFSLSGLSKGVSISPDQKLEFQVWFHPSTSGNAAQTLTIGSSSLSRPIQVAVSGSASNSVSEPAAPTHSVTLNWEPGPASVEGYYVYRGSVSGGPYQRITSGLVTSTSYKDTTVEA